MAGSPATYGRATGYDPRNLSGISVGTEVAQAPTMQQQRGQWKAPHEMADLRLLLRLRQGVSDRGGWEQSSRDQGAKFTIGSDLVCDWVVRGPGVAPFEVAVRVLDRRLYVRQLRQEGAVTLDGQPLRGGWCLLEDRSCLAFGGVRLQALVMEGRESLESGVVPVHSLPKRRSLEIVLDEPVDVLGGLADEDVQVLREETEPAVVDVLDPRLPPPLPPQAAIEWLPADTLASPISPCVAVADETQELWPLEDDADDPDWATPAVLEESSRSGGWRWYRWGLFLVSIGLSYTGWIYLLDSL